MNDTFNFLWDQGGHIFFWKEKQSWSIAFFIKNIFIEFPVLKLVSMVIMKIKWANELEITCENVINESSDNGSVKNNF